MDNISKRPLTSHATPLSPLVLGSNPPSLRWKEDLYRISMDPLVENDTHTLHWVLNKEQMSHFLVAFFSDARVFNEDAFPTTQLGTASLGSAVPTISSIFRSLPSTMYANNRFVTPTATKTRVTEASMSKFFNEIIQHVFTKQSNIHPAYKTREWTAEGANKSVSGCDALRKPDLILCREPVIGRKPDMRVDVLSIGEMKNSEGSDKLKDSFIELAGKVAFLHQAQDGRHATPCLRVLGEDIVFTLFNRGGSISTSPINMHACPELFLRILLGITFAPLMTLGFDLTVHDVKNRTRDIEVTLVDGTDSTINVTELIFISGSLHGRGTTVWSGQFTWLGVEQEVVVKDCFIDPLRRYTEGNILAMLNDAKVARVPQLIHEQLVQMKHPITKDILTNSTHILRTFLGVPPGNPKYQLRVLSRLVTMPRGYPIFEFTSLAELLIGFLDCITAHRDALERAKIIHRDVSLLNLLYAQVTEGDLLADILRSLPRSESEYDENLRQTLQGYINRWSPRRGLLADWGYAVPTMDHPGLSSSDDSLPSADSESEATSSQAPIHTRLQTLPTGHPLQNHGLDDVVSVKRLDSDCKAFVPLNELKTTDSIDILVANDIPPKGMCNAKDKLHRTGTWPWMAAELSHIGPEQPVDHKAEHDLESFFYVLLGVCLLFDEPKKIKPDEKLAVCFDPYFALFKPTVLKTLAVQSEFGWSTLILPNITSYFKPIIPLLNFVRSEFILSIKTDANGKFESNPQFEHVTFLSAIAGALVALPKSHWESRDDGNSGTTPSRQQSSTVPRSPAVTEPTSTVGPAPSLAPQAQQSNIPEGCSSSFSVLKLVPDHFDPPPSTVPASKPIDSPVFEFLPRPNMIRQMPRSSGSSSSKTRGANNPLKLGSSSGGNMKRVADEAHDELRPLKRQSNLLNAQPAGQSESTGLPRYQERRGGLGRLHGHTTPF